MPRNPLKPRVSPSWSGYSICGTPIENTRIICFKSPITCKRITPQTIVNHMQTKQYKLGLVIDLTDTTKYYDPNDFVANNIVHYKIKCLGMAIPSDDIVKHFHLIVQRFFKEHKTDGKLIGVHCMNGVNRTGYLVCRYLLDVLKWDPVRAIHAFQDAREHQIEHEYIRKVLLSYSLHENEEKKCLMM